MTVTILSGRGLADLLEDIVLGEVTLGVAVPYRYRDPARVTPQRLAELAARDRVARLSDVAGRQAAQSSHDDALSRMARYNQMRAAGTTITGAAAILGVSEYTAARYERQRLEEHAAQRDADGSRR